MSASLPNRDSGSGLAARLRENPRLRWGAWVIVAILWLYAALVLRDEAREKREAVEAAAKKVARLEAIATEKDWPARLRNARSLQQSLENRMWRAATLGLAQAGFQDWLTTVAQQSGLRATISVAAQEEASAEAKAAAGGGELWKASARIAFEFEPNALYGFLSRLETNERSVAVEALKIRGAPAPRVEMVLVAYFQRGTPPAPGSESRSAAAPVADAPRAPPPPAVAEQRPVPVPFAAPVGVAPPPAAAPPGSGPTQAELLKQLMLAKPPQSGAEPAGVAPPAAPPPNLQPPPSGGKP